MNKSFAAAAALALLTGSSEAKWGWGRCPRVENMANFDPARYSGKWYEIVRDNQNPWTLGCDCVTKEFAPYNEQSKSMDLYFRTYFMMRMGYMGIGGTLYQCDEGNPNSWTCQATMGNSDKRSDFDIFHTDYDNYEINYYCQERFRGRMKFEMLSVNSRTPEMSAENMAKVK